MMKFDKKKFEFVPNLDKNDDIKVSYGTIISTETFETSLFDKEFIFIKDCVTKDLIDNFVWMKETFLLLKAYKNQEKIGEEGQENLQKLRTYYSDRLYELFRMLDAIMELLGWDGESKEDEFDVDKYLEFMMTETEKYREEDAKYEKWTNLSSNQKFEESLRKHIEEDVDTKKFIFQYFNPLNP